MATFQVSKKDKKRNKNAKAVAGWILLAISTFVFLFSVTKLIPFLNYFFLGIFGVFVYPLCLVGFVISLALLNNKKYVMPKRYAIFLCLSLFLFLSIIQLIIVGSPSELAYGQYVGLNYSKQMTAGGMLIGFLPTSLAYLMGIPATYVVLSVGLLASIAFFVEAVISMRKTQAQNSPVRLQIKEKDKPKAPFSRKKEAEKLPEIKLIHHDEIKEPEEEIKSAEEDVMFAGNVKQEEKREMTAREKLGLVGGFKHPIGEPIVPDNIKLPPEPEETKLPPNMSMREYLLSPPQVDLEKFNAQQNRLRAIAQASGRTKASVTTQIEENVEPQVNAVQSEIELNISSLKNDSESIEMPVIEEQRLGNLPEISPEEITSEAEDIIRAVVEEEKLERMETQTHKDEQDSEFISFDDIEEEKPAEPEIVEPIVETKPQDFSRDGFARDRLDRGGLSDRGLSRENPLSVEPSQETGFTRERGLGELSIRNALRSGREEQNVSAQNNDQRPQRPLDEIDRRKGFVNTEEKKEEPIKPYKYTRPSLDLLTTQSDDLSIFSEEVPKKSVALENALENFGIPAKVQNVVIGPTVTRYEIEMPEGISVKRILSLDADIAYALSAKGQIRIEAPIPGRSIVGIEVPNSKVAKVSIKDVLQAKEFALSPSPLTFALGKDITGTVKVCNLQKMPHLLVAGTTGSGKSVCLNAIITSILFKSSPDEVKFIMIDPKQVELSMYEGLPHMVVPKVITDPNKAVNALQWAVDEMERRFNLISEERVRNIDEYNKLDKVLQNKVKKMPYIVIIFDEFADFMQVAKNEIEDKVRRITAKARASGIHLILATQRPSTDVVTGTLKANLPARIAFKVASRVDSEVIMGAPGAEKLLGWGDMLYKPADAAASRIQGCLIETEETKAVVNYIIENNEEIYDADAFNAINNPGKGSNGGGEGNGGVDPLLPQALKICIDNGVASITMLQRKLAIGYPKAAKIIDQMQERGYISSADGAKQRAVYISIEEFYAIFGDIYD